MTRGRTFIAGVRGTSFEKLKAFTISIGGMIDLTEFLQMNPRRTCYQFATSDVGSCIGQVSILSTKRNLPKIRKDAFLVYDQAFRMAQKMLGR
jgi:hypothetical protein